MVKINIEIEPVIGVPQEEIDSTDIVEIAEASDSVYLHADVTLLQDDPIFESGEIAWNGREPDLDRIRGPVDEMKEQLDEYEEIICSYLDGGYSGMVTSHGCNLFREFDDYQTAYEEAKRLEQKVPMLDGSVILRIAVEDISEQAAEAVESRINVYRN